MEEELLPMVAKNYRFNIRRAELLHYTTRTFVLRIQTDDGPFVVKSIFADRDRMDFILAVEHYLRGRGVAIPRTIPMENGAFLFFCNGTPYTVQEYVEGRPLFITSKSACHERGRLLGHFHACSLGFRAEDVKPSMGILEWEANYQKGLQTISDWREQYRFSTEKRHQLVMRSVDFFLRTGAHLLRLLTQNQYFAEVQAEPVERQFLCHGDFHTGNVLWNEQAQRFSIIDWEFTRFDFPSVDLGRLLSIIMRQSKRWDQASFSALLSGYLEQNPLSEKQMELLYLDLAFPHQFERFLRKNWFEEFTTGEIRQFLQREEEKTRFLLQTLER
ncbi:CotS family spore coat protein [Brevibacillus fluminis]|uniref:CotS family spore coat protein n=1 Tax=Brevibacillus fluminis TaxID=511487 RepID=UPI003F8CD081